MNSEDETKFKEFIFQAHQAGKSETSQLFKSIKDEIKSITTSSATHHTKINQALLELKNETINNTKALKDHDATIKSHNGRLSKVEKTLLIVGAVTATMMLMNGSKVIELVGIIL